MAFGDNVSSVVSLPSNGLQTTAAVFLVTMALVKLVTMAGKKRYNLPPGPRGLPLVGYLPFFGTEPAATFNELRKTYGDVISISMGSWPAVVVNGRDAIREALVTKGDDFSGRPAFTTARLLNDGRNFGFSLFGPLWKTHRKVVSNVLYTFSNARNNPIEDIICREATTVCEEFLAHGDAAFCPLTNLELGATSMIFQLCFGAHRNIREDAAFMSAIDGQRTFGKFTRAGNPVDVMPWLRHFMPWKVSQFLELISGSISRRKRKVAEHEKAYDANDLRDITDGLLHAADHLSPTEKTVGMDKVRVMESLDTILGAGAGTVSSALQWAVCLMAAHPDLQEQVFQQIDAVVGQEREPTLKDRANLPLVDATIHEVLRFSCSSPFSLPHSTICDTTLFGYDVPAGTVVLVNLQSIFVDKDLWGDPHNFRPQRFLSSGGSDGGLDRGLVEQVSAFSMGRRRCVGEHLARMELFLFFTTLLQRLRFCRPPGHPPYTLQAINALTRDLLPYDICVTSRRE